MTSLAWILGIVGFLCAAMGVVTAMEIILPVYDAFTPDFWLTLATVLMLATIACALIRGGKPYEG